MAHLSFWTEFNAKPIIFYQQDNFSSQTIKSFTKDLQSDINNDENYHVRSLVLFHMENKNEDGNKTPMIV